jgi:hypothetical protein
MSLIDPEDLLDRLLLADVPLPQVGFKTLSLAPGLSWIQ